MTSPYIAIHRTKGGYRVEKMTCFQGSYYGEPVSNNKYKTAKEALPEAKKYSADYNIELKL